MKYITFAQYLARNPLDVRDVAFLNRHPEYRYFEDVDNPASITIACAVTSCTVNSDCDRVQIAHSYQPKSIEPVTVYPYTFVEGRMIFSDPPSFVVGYHNGDGYGDIAVFGWEEKLLANNINRLVIDKLKQFFAGHVPPEDIDVEVI